MRTAARTSLAACLLFASCGKDGEDTEPTDTDGADTDAPPDTDPDTDVEDTDDVVVGTPPVILSASLRNPGAHIRYARWLDVETDEPVRIHAEWRDGEHVLSGEGEPEYLTSHAVPVIGLRPDGNYTLTVTATDAQGTPSAPTTLTIEVEPLVDPFPEIEIIRNEPANMEPGFTLVQLSTDDAGYVVAFDDEFQPVWLTVDPEWEDIRRTENGTLFGTHGGEVREETFLGEVLRRYDDEDPEATQVPFPALRHEAYPLEHLADGSFLSLSYALHEVPNYPTDYRDPDGPRAPATIRSTVLAHIAGDGEVVYSVDTADLLDVTRIGFDSIAPDGGEVHDWDKGNAIVPHHQADRYIVSLRHQDAVMKVSNTGFISWILADPAGWSSRYQSYLLRKENDEPFVWSYHQHAPFWGGANGKLILMDNHNFGRTPYSPPPAQEPHARIVEYKINEALLRVQMINSVDTFTEGVTIVSNDLGSAVEIRGSQNVLADFGKVTAEGGVSNEDNGRGRYSVRIVEYFPGSQATPALDVRLTSDPATRPYGWTSYRATRIERLGQYGVIPTTPAPVRPQ